MEAPRQQSILPAGRRVLGRAQAPLVSPPPAEELGLSESPCPAAEGPSTIDSPQPPAKPGDPTGERPTWWHRCRGLRGCGSWSSALAPSPLKKNLLEGAAGLEPCRCAAGDEMAIYLVGLAVPGSAAWGSGKGASMEQGNLP